MTDRLIDAELLELRKLNAEAQSAALDAQMAAISAQRAQQALQDYVHQLEIAHEWLGMDPQINISGAVRFGDQKEQSDE